MNILKSTISEDNQSNILVIVCVAVVAGVLGSVLAPDHTTQITGFCILIVTAVLGLLKQSAIQSTVEASHILVNSNFEQQLKIAAVALRRVASLTDHPADDEAATLAENLFHEHEARQKSVDKNSVTMK